MKLTVRQLRKIIKEAAPKYPRYPAPRKGEPEEDWDKRWQVWRAGDKQRRNDKFASLGLEKDPADFETIVVVDNPGLGNPYSIAVSTLKKIFGSNHVYPGYGYGYDVEHAILVDAPLEDVEYALEDYEWADDFAFYRRR